jgi:GxxExxY protein
MLKTYFMETCVENDLSFIIIGAALQIHRTIGPGLLESAYENALAYELKKKDILVRQQVPLPFIYNDVNLEVGYRIDLLIAERVIVEIKSVDTLAPVHKAQTLTYLKLSGFKLALLINFNCALLRTNIFRFVNGL